MDAVLATLLAPIMAEHRSFVNGDMRSGAATRIRAESRKGDRGQTAGIVAAKSFLANARGERAAADVSPPPPAEPAAVVTLQRGVDVVRIQTDADGRAWGTGALKSLATLPWVATQWEGACVFLVLDGYGVVWKTHPMRRRSPLVQVVLAARLFLGGIAGL